MLNRMKNLLLCFKIRMDVAGMMLLEPLLLNTKLFALAIFTMGGESTEYKQIWHWNTWNRVKIMQIK